MSNQKCDSEQSGQAHLKPIYLLADSRLLFESRAYGSRFLDDIVGNARVENAVRGVHRRVQRRQPELLSRDLFASIRIGSIAKFWAVV